MSDVIEKVDTSNEACAVACMIVSNPGGGMQTHGWQKRVNDVIRGLRDERNAASWKPIDSAPTDGTKVDLWCRAPGLSAGPGRVPDCWYYDGKWWRYDSEYGDDQNRSRVHNATHWMRGPGDPHG